MKIKHKFVYKTVTAFIFEVSGYLTSGHYCEICGKSAVGLFRETKRDYTDFGNIYEQEDWLNNNTSCLSEDEFTIKTILE